MELNLLEKTELWIENLSLDNADLNKVAEAVARVLELPREEVLVVDVRENHITLDILQQKIKAEQIFGRKAQLLKALEGIPGIKIFSDTDIHSNGILGTIGLDETEAAAVLQKTEEIGQEIAAKLKKRVKVFPTGFEVKKGMIKDTNTPLIMEEMTGEGFKVTAGEVLDDDCELIAGKLRRAVNEGFGVIITTGGIGAEDKDQTVEAILKIDSQAVTPYVVKFKKGTGRHEKDGVRIGVGQSGHTLLIALPGPNDEVKVALEVVKSGLKNGWSKSELAYSLAEALREKLRGKMKEHYH